jgi:voltage-gated potassium channel Kch
MSSSHDAPSARERVRYAFDNLMARGTSALIALLAAGTALLILAWSLLVSALGLLPDELRQATLPRRLWYALMRTMDAGTLGGDAGSWTFLLANLAVTLGGIFIFSALIGVLNAGLESRLDGLRKGRSRVIERDHTVILGWGPTIFTVLEELILANESRRGACIVILAPEDKVAMEDAIRERIEHTKSTRIVCRSGAPSDPADLKMASVQTSRSILILPPEDDDGDVQVIKSLLAILRAPDRREAPYHIVAALSNDRNLGIARMVAGEEAELILTGDLISRVTVQTCRQSGLSVVHGELLDFDGDELYFGATDGLAGGTFGDALLRYPASCVIGLLRQGRTIVLPALDTVIEPGDRVLAISEDDVTVLPAATSEPVDESAIVAPDRGSARPERTLILGTSERLGPVVTGLDAYVAQGSDVLVVASALSEEAVRELGAGLTRQTIAVQRADPTDRAALDALEIPGFDHVIVLSDPSLDAERADARVLLTLLHLRDIGHRAGRAIPVVSEMRVVQNRALAEATDADDFIVSDRLVSLLLCQIAENKALAPVLADLFDPEGAEVYLKPATDYVRDRAEVSFATVVESARRRGEIAIGFRVRAECRDPARRWGVRINPPKRERVALGEGDRVIVVAHG